MWDKKLIIHEVEMAVKLKVQTERDVLDEMVRRIVKQFRPQRIILFGSRARGDARTDSDYDILIIGPSDRGRSERTGLVYESLWDVGASKDILWWTEEEAAEWSGVRNHITTVAQREGKVVYEAAA